MKWYITDNLNAANQLLTILNDEWLEAMNTKVFIVEEVQASFPDKKFKIYTETDEFRTYARILDRITNLDVTYGDIITHKDGGLYAIPIIVGLPYYDVEQRVKDLALAYGYIVNELPPDWFPTI